MQCTAHSQAIILVSGQWFSVTQSANILDVFIAVIFHQLTLSIVIYSKEFQVFNYMSRVGRQNLQKNHVTNKQNKQWCGTLLSLLHFLKPLGRKSGVCHFNQSKNGLIAIRKTGWMQTSFVHRLLPEQVSSS